MVKKYVSFVLGACLFFMGGCSSSPQKKGDEHTSSQAYTTPIKMLSDKEYPDDPDVILRSKAYGNYAYKEVVLTQKDSTDFSIVLLPDNPQTDTIVFPSLALLDFIPTVPSFIRGDAYLSFISLVNLEWNRQQVKFDGEKDYYVVQGESKADFSRIDIARNCLNTGLWEIIAYSNKTGSDKVVYHGWFDFPILLFERLFNVQNPMKFNDYKDFLVDWKDPESKVVDLSHLREMLTERSVGFTSKNAMLYPLKGERKKKFKNIIHPKNPKSINDFLTDSTRFATFTPPGFYNTADPRKTELGRFKHLKLITLRDVVSFSGDTLSEFEFEFLRDNGEVTRMLIGDLDLSEIPVLSDSMLHKGFQMPMGIGNHSFYEAYDYAVQHHSIDNPYYGLLLSEDGYWIDSHAIGIDGPLFYFDHQGQLHFLILSFERHAFVGHYVLEV